MNKKEIEKKREDCEKTIRDLLVAEHYLQVAITSMRKVQRKLHE